MWAARINSIKPPTLFDHDEYKTQQTTGRTRPPLQWRGIWQPTSHRRYCIDAATAAVDHPLTIMMMMMTTRKKTNASQTPPPVVADASTPMINDPPIHHCICLSSSSTTTWYSQGTVIGMTKVKVICVFPHPSPPTSWSQCFLFSPQFWRA